MHEPMLPNITVDYMYSAVACQMPNCSILMDYVHFTGIFIMWFGY